MHAGMPLRSRVRARRSLALISLAAAVIACAPADDTTPDTTGAAGEQDADTTTVADTVASAGWQASGGEDPANPFAAPAEVVSRYLDETLQYRTTGTSWVQIPGDTPDSAQVRFEVVRGSHLIGEDAFAEDGHVIHRYVLESRDRTVPALGLSPNDTLGYMYVLPGRIPGEHTRYRARFAVRTANGGWRPSDTQLTVIPGTTPPSDVPEGSWLVWGAHEDDEYMQSRDSLSRELFGRTFTMSAADHCFLCGLHWCWVTTE